MTADKDPFKRPQAGDRIPVRLAMRVRVGDFEVGADRSLVFRQIAGLRLPVEGAEGNGQSIGKFDAFSALNGKRFGSLDKVRGKEATFDAVRAAEYALQDEVLDLLGKKPPLSDRHLLPAILPRPREVDANNAADVLRLLFALRQDHIGHLLFGSKKASNMDLADLAREVGAQPAKLKSWMEGSSAVPEWLPASLRLLIRLMAETSVILGAEEALWTDATLGLSRFYKAKNPSVEVAAYTEQSAFRVGHAVRELHNMIGWYVKGELDGASLDDPNTRVHVGRDVARLLAVIDNVAESTVSVWVDGKKIISARDWWLDACAAAGVADPVATTAYPLAARVIDGVVRVQLFGNGEDPGYRATLTLVEPDEYVSRRGQRSRISEARWKGALDDFPDADAVMGTFDEVRLLLAEELTIRLAERLARPVPGPSTPVIGEARAIRVARELEAVCRRNHVIIDQSTPLVLRRGQVIPFRVEAAGEVEEVGGRPDVRRRAPAWRLSSAPTENTPIQDGTGTASQKRKP